MRSTPFAYGEITMWKGVLFLRKDDVKPGGPTQMVLGVALGGVVAIVVELLVLLAGAAAISSGLLRENAQLQLVAMACVLGGLVGGLVCACRWPARKLLGGLAAGLTCGVLLWIISAARGGGQVLEVRGLVVLTSCLCGGALAGLLCLRFGRKKPASVRRRRV